MLSCSQTNSAALLIIAKRHCAAQLPPMQMSQKWTVVRNSPKTVHCTSERAFELRSWQFSIQNPQLTILNSQFSIRSPKFCNLRSPKLAVQNVPSPQCSQSQTHQVSLSCAHFHAQSASSDFWPAPNCQFLITAQFCTRHRPPTSRRPSPSTLPRRPLSLSLGSSSCPRSSSSTWAHFLRACRSARPPTQLAPLPPFREDNRGDNRGDIQADNMGDSRRDIQRRSQSQAGLQVARSALCLQFSAAD